MMMTAAGCALGTKPEGCDDMQANADERGMQETESNLVLVVAPGLHEGKTRGRSTPSEKGNLTRSHTHTLDVSLDHLRDELVKAALALPALRTEKTSELAVASRWQR